jgi:hypothetical protein
MLSQLVNIPEELYFKSQRSSRSIWWRLSLALARLAMTYLSWSLTRGFIPGRWIIWRTVTEGVAIICLFIFSFKILKKIPPWRVPGYVKPLRTISREVSWVPATPCSLLNVNADYRVRTIEEVNKIVATRTALNFRNVDFLSYVHHRESLEATTPSWVPKWQEHTDDKDILSSFTEIPYHADAGQTSAHPPLITDDMVALQGIQVGSISHVSDTMRAPDFDLKDHPSYKRYSRNTAVKRIYMAQPGQKRKKHVSLSLTASQAFTDSRTGESWKSRLRNDLQAERFVSGQKTWDFLQSIV